MDVGFGLCPNYCYYRPVKAIFVTKNSRLPTGHLIQNNSLFCGETQKKQITHSELWQYQCRFVFRPVTSPFSKCGASGRLLLDLYFLFFHIDAMLGDINFTFYPN